jgi:hypothetical protein
MTEVFNGELYVHYGQAYVFSYRGCDFSLMDCFENQVNGLCGTAVPGVIFLITGLHTGRVGLIVEVLESPPPVDHSWEEIVEAPFSVGAEADGEGVRLEDWNGDRVCSIPLPLGNYRVRYCARNMDAGRDADTIVDEAIIDFYALYFWPDGLSPDAVISQKSRVATYWHTCASS